jgi:Protein of unknown function (DUF3619)
MSSAVDTKEREFALAIRRALDESADGLPQPTLTRLAQARRVALQRKKPHMAPQTVLAPAAAGAPFVPGERQPVRRAPRLVLIWPILALAAALICVAYWEDQQRIAETADIDAAMLSDELPLNAYLDHGFNAYLSHAR